MDAVKNFAKVTVSTGYDDNDVTIALSSGGGAKLPAPATDGEFNLTWWNSTDYSDPSDDPNVEIVRCTARSTDTLTVTRAQEGTSGSNKNTSAKTYKMMLTMSKKTMDDLKALITSLPDGHLFNGKIVPSVSSNNLTVAIKTLAGNDASINDPIYVRIDGTVRAITASLSFTINAGTNFLNMGGTALATKEVDLFVYLGWNVTGGNIMLVISRIPYATRLDSFVYASNTDEKGIGITGSASSAVSDPFVNIGRFAGTLSAGAGYTWTVPTYTRVNLIQKPVFETRLLSYLPTLTVGDTGSSMTLRTSSGITGNYKIHGSDIDVNGYVAQSKNGSATTYDVFLTAPMAMNIGVNQAYGVASIDNLFGNVGLYGGDTASKFQIRTAVNMSVDASERSLYYRAFNVPLI